MDILDKRCQRWCCQGGEKEEDHAEGWLRQKKMLVMGGDGGR